MIYQCIGLNLKKCIGQIHTSVLRGPTYRSYQSKRKVGNSLWNLFLMSGSSFGKRVMASVPQRGETESHAARWKRCEISRKSCGIPLRKQTQHFLHYLKRVRFRNNPGITSSRSGEHVNGISWIFFLEMEGVPPASASKGCTQPILLIKRQQKPLSLTKRYIDHLEATV